jgi:hypothetical protein
VRDREALPAVGEAENRRVGRHHVEHELIVTPATDHAAVHVLAEAVTPKALLEFVKAPARCSLHDHVDVLGGPRNRCCRIGDPKPNRGTADEDDLVEQVTEGGGGEFEQLDAHAIRSRSNSVARPRVRASPIRIASTSVSIS